MSRDDQPMSRAAQARTHDIITLVVFVLLVVVILLTVDWVLYFKHIKVKNASDLTAYTAPLAGLGLLFGFYFQHLGSYRLLAEYDATRREAGDQLLLQWNSAGSLVKRGLVRQELATFVHNPTGGDWILEFATVLVDSDAGTQPTTIRQSAVVAFVQLENLLNLIDMAHLEGKINKAIILTLRNNDDAKLIRALGGRAV